MNKEEKVGNNILVIGNGFDLAHGLPTKYNDFIRTIERNFFSDTESHSEKMSLKFSKSKIRNNGFINYFLHYAREVPGWVDIEQLMKEIIDYFEVFFENYQDIIMAGGGLYKGFINTIPPDIEKNKLVECLLKFPLFSEEKYFDLDNDNKNRIMSRIFYTNDFGLKKKKILELLKKQLDEVIELLCSYLEDYCYEKQKDQLKTKKQISDIHPCYVISFNYTDTYKVYGIKAEDVFHVHGSIEKKNMVLGFDDDEPENLDFVYFKKYFQRIQKLTGYIDQHRFDIKKCSAEVTSPANINSNIMEERDVEPIVHFYGHSMDKTDGDVIKKLKKISRGFVIYKYSQEDYEQKVINLIDVFGKKDAMDMIEKGFIKFENCE